MMENEVERKGSEKYVEIVGAFTKFGRIDSIK
jgi:hypothetical protein